MKKFYLLISLFSIFSFQNGHARGWDYRVHEDYKKEITTDPEYVESFFEKIGAFSENCERSRNILHLTSDTCHRMKKNYDDKSGFFWCLNGVLLLPAFSVDLIRIVAYVPPACIEKGIRCTVKGFSK